ncbi:MAG: PolC-type DNA polymerase III [Lachnospiraceae bacterium]|nr:PolC-type DNA polymerase III [Lachnospiraceae bacterium]
MDSKRFTDVFPTLKLPSELQELILGVRINKILRSRDRKGFHIYAESPAVIRKDYIYRIERELQKQVFNNTGVKPRIHESFRLNGEFTAENIMEIYRESIALELREDYPIINQLFRNSDISVEDNTVFLDVPSEMIFGKEAERMAYSLSEYFSNVFNKRFSVKTEIRLDFIKAEVSLERQQVEEELQREFRELMANRSSASAKEAPAAEKKSDVKRGGSARRPAIRRTSDPDVLYRSDVTGDSIPIMDIVEPVGEVIIKGQFLSYDEIPIKNNLNIITMGITDFTDSINIKLYINNEDLPEFREKIGAAALEDGKPGIFVKVKGLADIDKYEHDVVITSVRGIRKTGSFKKERRDLSSVKRTELHCHTKFSEMDGVSSVEDILKTADSWGWNSLAITDHGNVQVYPAASHAVEKLSNPDFKIIYGVEGYLVDDENRIVWSAGLGDGRENSGFDESYVVFDIETTGFSAKSDRIIEIGAVRVENGQVTDTFDEFVNPEIPIPLKIQSLTGINDEMVRDAETIDHVLPRFLEFAANAVIVAHNAAFDTGFIREKAGNLGLSFDKTVIDTLGLGRFLMPDLNNHKLDTLSTALEVSLENHHRAVDDATATGYIFIKLLEKLYSEYGDTVHHIRDLKNYDKMGVNTVKKLPYYHIIILAKNETGRLNLYKLVSESHLNYFQRRPRIPRSLLSENREGLILGSACEAGELYQALENEESMERIAKIVDFYDYLEIQPLGNNEFLLRESNRFDTLDDLKDINKEIVRLGEKFNKPVCATCDVHFLNPEDEVYRRIIMFSKGYKDADEQAPLYLRTTEEMLHEFSYLGEDKAEEVVIKNPNMIADMIDRISPVRPDKAPPVIENSDKILRDICYNRARELYGENLPEPVTERLDRELDSIIGNGYAVMYVIAQKLVWKSNEDGYLVGSRGSVGSSFAAYMSGITEVNSLAPHYLCPKCHYSDFESETVKKAHEEGLCGCDLPDQVCPECGEKLMKMGFDIPFETFLGFKGDKEPDIDLNFSGDYQSKAHKYTEVIFGAGQTFRAGTTGTVADKTAFSYTRSYFEAETHNEYKRRIEMERLAKGCEGVLRTTGQHPGGIIVLPRGEEIDSFTPRQHPANDQKNPIITTHFDYHSIDHNLLKLDILGHDDPTMIRFLEDATGVDINDISFDDKDVMSLFNSPEILGITPRDIDGCPTGSLGIPEYGTEFVIQMLVDTHPATFSDLVRISGLSHGTDVWSGNAELLVKQNGMPLSECICCRDDIMLYLMNKGLDPSQSFKIMESVRKGKVAKGKEDKWESWKQDMISNAVPDWYMDSCEKIKYMFPKAHAVAYVMMAWRVAWFKINYPLAYYSAFFSIRSSKSGGIDYETMCQGPEKLMAAMKELKDKLKAVGKKKMTATELDTIKNMQLVQEMYARGFSFLPIDLYESDPKYFRKADDKNIMPPLCSIAGMGEKDADDLAAGLRNTKDKGDFLSLEDFVSRTGCSKNKAEKLKEIGILRGIPDTNQLSLFDFVETD